jgi:hypothetical protein
LILGIAVLYYFIVSPFILRSRIRNSAGTQELSIEFDNDKIVVNIANVGIFIREWDELICFMDAKKGIVFYFRAV